MSRLRRSALRIVLAMVCLPSLATISPPPASAHTTTTYHHTYVTMYDCTGAYSFFGHNPYFYVGTRATTITGFSWNWGQYSPSGEPCGAARGTNAQQLLVHPISYKNGDGRGGYEVRYDWGVYGNPCCSHSSFHVYFNHWLSNYWGPGWYSMDHGSASYIRNEGAMRGGWSYAVFVEWMPSPE